MDEIRLAKYDDIPQLAALLAQLFAQEAEFTPAPQRQIEGLRRISAMPRLAVSSSRSTPARPSAW